MDIYPLTLENHQHELDATVEIDDLRTTLFNMGALKDRGDDEFPTLFFQKYWDVNSPNSHGFIEQVWSNPETIKEVNNTLIVFIPKIDKPEFVSQYRPISLCIIVYKLVTNVTVNQSRLSGWKRNCLSLAGEFHSPSQLHPLLSHAILLSTKEHFQ